MKKPLKTTLTILLIVAHNLMLAQNIEVSGNVFGTWSADTVKVTDNISVPKNQTLEIEAGVVVEFKEYYHLEVKGTIRAIGEPLLPIVFTVIDTLNLYDISIPRGAWRGIIIEKDRDDEEPTAFFKHCHFEYSKKFEGDEIHHGGAVFIKDVKNVSFDSCTFLRNHSYLSGGAIYFYGSSPLITNCHFLENKAGHIPFVDEFYGYGGGVCGLHTSAIIRNNVFSGNWASGMGGGLSIDQGNPTIEGNIFEGNDGPLGGGFGILRSTLENTISNNLVINNFSMFFGGGMALIATTATVANNTVCQNSSPGAGGGALYFNVGSNVGFYNNIFWDNFGSTGNLAFVFDTSTPSFHFNNIQGGYATIQGGGNYVFENNIDEYPLFVGSGQHPFSLHSNSPCINSGIEDYLFLNLPENDFAGNPRVQLGRIDMGAYESAISTVGSVDLLGSQSQMVVFPNPARSNTNISITANQLENQVKLVLLNSKGQVSVEVFNGSLPAGHHKFLVDFSNHQLGKGIYFVVYESSGVKNVEKLLVF